MKPQMCSRSRMLSMLAWYMSWDARALRLFTLTRTCLHLRAQVRKEMRVSGSMVQAFLSCQAAHVPSSAIALATTHGNSHGSMPWTSQRTPAQHVTHSKLLHNRLLTKGTPAPAPEPHRSLCLLASFLKSGMGTWCMLVAAALSTPSSCSSSAYLALHASTKFST